MWKFLNKLILNPVVLHEKCHTSLIGLSPPSKRAIKKRDERVAEAIKAMGADKYLKVPFKKEVEPPKLASVSKIRKSA